MNMFSTLQGRKTFTKIRNGRKKSERKRLMDLTVYKRFKLLFVQKVIKIQRYFKFSYSINKGSISLFYKEFT